MKIALFLFSIFLSFSAIADEVTNNFYQQFQDWSIFKISRNGKNICYALSLPIKSDGDNIDRGEPYLIVTNSNDNADEVAVSSGFIYEDSSDIEVSFSSKKFYLFPYFVIAWANNKNDDIEIIKEMQKSPELTIAGISKNGKIVFDNYSLIGFNEGYAKLKRICKND